MWDPHNAIGLQGLLGDSFTLLTLLDYWQCTTDNNTETKENKRPCCSSGDYSPVSHHGDPGQVMWDLWWTTRNWERFFPSSSVSPAKHSTDCSTLIIIRGWYKRPVVASVIVDSVPLHPQKEKGGIQVLLRKFDGPALYCYGPLK
jgi:hypothetical protein